MGFDLLSFLSTLLGGFNVPDIQARLTAWLEQKGAEYPDLRSRTDALAAWLAETLAAAEPALDLTAMHDTLWGIASDIVHGTAGVNPGAWRGGV